jgi:hypothetical protein
MQLSSETNAQQEGRQTMTQKKRWIFGLTVMALLGGLWSVPALAAPTAQEMPRSHNWAKYAYKLLLNRLDHQQDELDDTQAGFEVLQEFIEDEKAAGFDTSILEDALTEAQAYLDEAQTHHDEAALVLEGGAGFDADGNVTDPELVRETMREGRRAMRQAGRAIRDGRHEIRLGMRDYHRQQRRQ